MKRFFLDTQENACFKSRISILFIERYYFASGIKGKGVIKETKVFISHRSLPTLPSGSKCTKEGQERESVLFILSSHPTRIFNLAFLLQHLLRIIRVEDVWHLADPSHLFARYIAILTLHTVTHTRVDFPSTFMESLYFRTHLRTKFLPMLHFHAIINVKRVVRRIAARNSPAREVSKIPRVADTRCYVLRIFCQSSAELVSGIRHSRERVSAPWLLEIIAHRI